MQFFDSPNHVTANGFAIVDYDPERQVFLLTKGCRSFTLRSRHDGYTIVVPEET